MKKSNNKHIIPLLLIFISTLLTIILIDVKFNIKLFGDFSIFFNNLIYNLFGTFSVMFISSGFVMGCILLTNLKIFNKIFIIAGYLLMISFIPVFLESYNLFHTNTGFFGINFSKSFLGLNVIKKTFLFFFWFSSSVLFLSFPIKNQISILIFSILNKKNKTEKFNGNNISRNIKVEKINLKQKKVNNKKRDFPFLSKIIYENNNRVEIPILPNNEKKIKKFILLNKDDKLEEYEEVDNFNYEKGIVKKENYFNELKKDWPENWKKNNPLVENYEIIQDDSTLDLPQESNIDFNKNLLPVLKNDHFDDNSKKHNKIKIVNFMDNEIKTNKNIFDNENLPETDILENEVQYNYSQFKTEHYESAKILEQTLIEFGIKAEVTEIIYGPVVTLFKLIPAAGIKLQKIESLSNNLALRLAAKSIRIIARFPAKKSWALKYQTQNES